MCSAELNMRKSFITLRPGIEVIKHFSCSIQQSIEFPLLMKIKILKTTIFLAIKLPNVVFILLITIKNCWHFNIYEQLKFHAHFS